MHIIGRGALRYRRLTVAAESRRSQAVRGCDAEGMPFGNGVRWAVRSIVGRLSSFRWRAICYCSIGMPCLYYITISAGFQPVFLFLYEILHFFMIRAFLRIGKDYYEQAQALYFHGSGNRYHHSLQKRSGRLCGIQEHT